MLCQNCGKQEASVHYTQIVNGVKKEMILCEDCAKELGVEKMNFNMPIHFSNFFEDMFEPYHDSFFGSLASPRTMICEKCNTSYDDFIQDGFLGCENCYETFENRMDEILKSIQGANVHIGRKAKSIGNNNKEQTNIKEQNKENKQANKIEELKAKLKKEISEERYEDAAKTRDEIKKLENK